MNIDWLFAIVGKIPGVQLFFLLSVPARLIIAAIVTLIAAGVIVSSFRMLRQMRQIIAVRQIRKTLHSTAWNDFTPDEPWERIKSLTAPVPVVYQVVLDVERLIAQSARHFIPDAVDLSWRRQEESGWLTMVPRLAILFGFLGTLLGLTTAVENVFFKLETMSDIDSLRAPIQETLSGLSIAFTTTLAGVFAALMMTPYLLAVQRIHARWKQAVEGLLLIDILPILLPEDLNFVETVRTLVEKVSRQVVEQSFGEVIRETSNRVQELTLQLTGAVRIMGEHRADVGTVVENLDKAAASMQSVSDRSCDVLGRLDERLWTLSETVSSMTPESDLRLLTIQTIGETFNRVLADQWSDLRRHLQEQMERIHAVSTQMEKMEISLIQSVHQLDGDFSDMPDWRSLLQDSLSPLTQVSQQSLQLLDDLKQTVFSARQDMQQQWNDGSSWRSLAKESLQPLIQAQQECNRLLLTLIVWMQADGKASPRPEIRTSELDREKTLRQIQEIYSSLPQMNEPSAIAGESGKAVQAIRDEIDSLTAALNASVSAWNRSSQEIQSLCQTVRGWVEQSELEKQRKSLRKERSRRYVKSTWEKARSWAARPIQWLDRYQRRGRK